MDLVWEKRICEHHFGLELCSYRWDAFFFRAAQLHSSLFAAKFVTGIGKCGTFDKDQRICLVDDMESLENSKKSCVQRTVMTETTELV
jgi:hypothetical protein